MNEASVLTPTVVLRLHLSVIPLQHCVQRLAASSLSDGLLSQGWISQDKLKFLSLFFNPVAKTAHRSKGKSEGGGEEQENGFASPSRLTPSESRNFHVDFLEGFTSAILS